MQTKNNYLVIVIPLLLLLLSRFSRVQPCVNPETAAHQAPPSLGVSRQKHWSGLPFPSPMHACMLSGFSRVQLCATLWTAAHQAPLCIGFSKQEEWTELPYPPPGIFLTQQPNLSVSCLLHRQAGSLPLVPPGKVR